jgi:uridine kinase
MKLPNAKLVHLDGILGDGELYSKENVEEGVDINFSENRTSPQMVKIISNYKSPILIIEGCFSFKIPINFDYKIWVECNKLTCFNRLIIRERNDRQDIAIKHIILANTQYQECEDKYIKNFTPSQEANFIYYT